VSICKDIFIKKTKNNKKNYVNPLSAGCGVYSKAKAKPHVGEIEK